MQHELTMFQLVIGVPRWESDDQLDDLLDKTYETGAQSKTEHVQEILDGPIGCGVPGSFGFYVEAPSKDALQAWAHDVVSELKARIPQASFLSISADS